MKRCPFALLVGGVLMLGACEKDEANRATQHDRRQFQVVMEGKLRQIDRGIEQVSGAAAGADSAYVADVESLRRSQRELRGRLSAMDAASDQNWPALKDSLEFHYHHIQAEFGELVVMREARAATAHVDSSSTRSTTQASQTN